MSEIGKQHCNRVIIGATCFADADGAIAMAAILARKLEGEILGLLIEDDAILRIAYLPSAKTLAFKGGSVQSITPEAMESAFQRDAKDFQRRLTRAAGQMAVNWSFERKRGQMMSLLQSVASTGDVVFLGHQRTSFSKGEIIFIDDTHGEKTHLLDMGMEISREMDLSLQRINLSKSDEPLTKPETGLLSTVSVSSKDEMLEYLHKTNPSAVFVALKTGHNFDLHEILEAARCPVILAIHE